MSQLKLRIAQGEGQHLDFKFRIDDQRKIARTLAAFANSGGGSLLIGIKDSGKIAGANPEEEFYMIQGAADLYTQPCVPFESQVWQEGHHLVLEIIVPDSDVKHQAKDEEDRWRYYVRVEDHTLLGNKILSAVWRMERSIKGEREEFDDETLAFLKLIREKQPLTLSKMYRISALGMRKVDHILATLVFWGVVEMHITESGTHYSIQE